MNTITIDRQLYMKFRRQGIAAQYAAGMARHVREVRGFEVTLDVGNDGSSTTYATTIDGVAYLITVGDDWEAGNDLITDECYGPDDLRAFEQGLAGFAWANVTATLPSGTTGESFTLGGIDHGWQWIETTGLDCEQQILSSILEHDLMGEARAAAEQNEQKANERESARIDAATAAVQQIRALPSQVARTIATAAINAYKGA